MYLWIIAIVLLVLATILTMVLAQSQKQQTTESAKLKDFKFPVPDEGTSQAVIFGDVWTTDWQVLGVSNYKTEAIHTSSGGRGGKK